MNFKEKKVAILGWGINGLDVYKYLSKQGAEMVVYGLRERERRNFVGIDDGVKVFFGENYLKGGLRGYDYIFRAPGVYRFIPELIEAEKRGALVTSATKLFFDLCPAKIIGITGTKGKGTTSTLVYQILKENGLDAYLAGNIGSPILELLPKLNAKSWVVLELSSFQLIDVQKSSHIAVILNITEDHLDWHKDRNEYIKSKIKMAEYQSKKDYAVLNYDYRESKNFSKKTKAKVKYFSTERKVNGSYIDDGEIILMINGKRFVVGKTKDLLLRGEHNWENVCAAVVTSSLAGASLNTIKKTIFSFTGLEHRLELVDEFEGIKFYNDSFSTNPQTTIAAVKSFTEPITLILGGSDKGLNYDQMGFEIAKSDNIENVFIIGQIADVIENSIQKSGYKRNCEKLKEVSMKGLLSRCIAHTPRGGVVLLSPATASFDMFKDYKDRGDQFKEAVLALKKTS